MRNTLAVLSLYFDASIEQQLNDFRPRTLDRLRERRGAVERRRVCVGALLQEVLDGVHQPSVAGEVQWRPLEVVQRVYAGSAGKRRKTVKTTSHSDEKR